MVFQTEHERAQQRSSSAGSADKEKMQRLYGKYLRAESFRKALVYQKKYLLLLLGGFQVRSVFPALLPMVLELMISLVYLLIL